VPLKVENRGPEVHVAYSTHADHLSVITVLAFIALFVGFMALLLFLGAF